MERFIECMVKIMCIILVFIVVNLARNAPTDTKISIASVGLVLEFIIMYVCYNLDEGDD